VNIQFNRLIIWSDKEATACDYLFNKHTTVFCGVNDTGKSAVIKSIYRTLGVSISHDDKWKGASANSALFATINNEEYVFLKFGTTHSIFHGNTLIVSSNKITSEYAPTFANLFNFRLKMADNDGDIVTPPPAFCVLPFYIDQDEGWTGLWTSLQNLRQFPKYKEQLPDYHLGIRNNEYYEAHSKLIANDREIASVNSEIRFYEKAKAKASHHDEYIKALPNIDIEAFNQEITELLASLGEVIAKQNKLRADLLSLQGELAEINHRIHLVDGAIKGSDKASKEIFDKYDGTNYECPVCKTHHDDGFAMVFTLAQDKNSLQGLLGDLLTSKIELQARISEKDVGVREMRLMQTKMQGTLDVKRGELRLRDYVEMEGVRMVNSFMNSEIIGRGRVIAELQLKAQSLLDIKKRFENKKRAKQIKADFLDVFAKNRYALSLPSDSGGGRRILYKVKGQGSARAREVLAHFFTMLALKVEYSDSPFFPVVIDSPDQQGQDSINLPQMINFIKGRLPAKAQLIIGLGEDPYFEESDDITIHQLNHKFSVLNKDTYNFVRPIVAEFLQTMCK